MTRDRCWRVSVSSRRRLSSTMASAFGSLMRRGLTAGRELASASAGSPIGAVVGQDRRPQHDHFARGTRCAGLSHGQASCAGVTPRGRRQRRCGLAGGWPVGRGAIRLLVRDDASAQRDRADEGHERAQALVQAEGLHRREASGTGR